MAKITLLDYVTASGRYPEREFSDELTPGVLGNAQILLDKVNALLEELGVESVSVSSGFRPSGVNAGIKNASKKSAHMTGEAIDIVDPQNKLSKQINKALLKKYDLYREDNDYTPTWLHLQTRRTKSGRRIFRP